METYQKTPGWQCDVSSAKALALDLRSAHVRRNMAIEADMMLEYFARTRRVAEADLEPCDLDTPMVWHKPGCGYTATATKESRAWAEREGLELVAVWSGWRCLPAPARRRKEMRIYD